MAKVDMGSLKPNSNKYKREGGETERESLSPVVNSKNVVTTKKSLGQKFAETFIGDDIQEVKKYVFWDMVLPGIKNFILDMLSMMFFGERSSRRDDYRSDRDYRDYTSSYRGRSSRERRRDSIRQDDDRNVDYRNIVLRYRRDAEEVVDRIYDRIESNGEASVADLLDLVGITSRFTDNNWGWTSKRDIGIRAVSNGFLIDVAPADDLRR